MLPRRPGELHRRAPVVSRLPTPASKVSTPLPASVPRSVQTPCGSFPEVYSPRSGTDPTRFAHGVDGPTAAMRRLPLLSRGSNCSSMASTAKPLSRGVMVASCPALVGIDDSRGLQSAGSMAMSQHQGLGDIEGVPPTPSQVATPTSPPRRNTFKKAKLDAGGRLAVTPHTRSSVWQRWQVNSHCTKHARDVVLERDRARQRNSSNLPRHNHASPARSHAAALFFAEVPGNFTEVTQVLPPGAFQRVARPRTRGFTMPHMVSGIVGQTSPQPWVPQHRLSLATNARSDVGKDSKKRGSTSSLVEEDQLLERGEVNIITEIMESYAALLNKTPAVGNTSTEDQALGTSRSTRGGTGRLYLWQDTSGAPAESMISRPIFCRFLLASKLCGSGTALAEYHVCVKAFDEHALPYGATTALAASKARAVMASILHSQDQEVPVATPPKPREDNPKEVRRRSFTLTNGSLGAGNTSPFSTPGRPSFRRGQQHRSSLPNALQAGDSVDAKHIDHGILLGGKPLRAKLFFSHGIPFAKAHIEGRSKRLEQNAAMKPVVEQEIVEVDPEDAVWPPLPPRFVTEQELPAYLRGVREWEQDAGRLSALRSHQLKTHTEGVLRGELLGSQLLEPEVLHCATRFRPLFEELFSSYADWPNQEVAVDESEVDAGFCDEQLRLGHMSFVAFFQFCVDFHLFPSHVSFEEIRQIYDDAETVLKVAPPKPPPPPPPVPLLEKEASFSPRSLTSERGAQPRRTFMSQKLRAPDEHEGFRRPSNQRQTSSLSPRTASSLSVGFHEPDKKSAKENHQVVQRKAQQHCDCAAASAAAALEAAIPKAKLEFLDKPVFAMSTLEVRTLCFFAAVDDWLSERCIRMPDLISPDPDDHEGVNLSCTSFVNVQELQNRAVQSYEREESAHAPAMRRPSDVARHQRCLAVVAACTAHAVEKIRPIVCVPPALLLQAVAPMSRELLPTEEEMISMYRLVLLGQTDADSGAGFPSVGGPAPPMTVFQLDKVLRKAREAHDQARKRVSYLMFLDSEFPPAVEELSPEQAIDSEAVAAARAGEVQRACLRFIEALDTQLLAQASMDIGLEEPIFSGGDVTTSDELLEKATELGVDPEKFPLPEELDSMFVDISGSPKVTRRSLYKALSFAQEGRSLQRKVDMKGRLTFLGGLDTKRHCRKPSKTIFGLAAFIECLLKLAFFSLGCKGTSEIQRRAPAWWKCAWLLTVLSGRFQERVRHHQHEQLAERLAVEDTPTTPRSLAAGSPISASRSPLKVSAPGTRSEDAFGCIDDEVHSPKKASARAPSGAMSPSISSIRRVSAGLLPGCATRKSTGRASRLILPELADSWFTKMRAPDLPKYTSPIDSLAAKSPLLFHPSHAEAILPGYEVDKDAGGLPWPSVACSQCNEQRSPSGWGSPACVDCGGIEEFCLPLRQHVFAGLLRTDMAAALNIIMSEEKAESAAQDSSEGSVASIGDDD